MNDRELLLLSNYVYMDASTDPMTIRESIDRFRNADGTFDEQSVAGAGIGGGMDGKQTADLFRQMDQMPDSFLDLYPSRVTDDPSLRGICYTNGKADGGKGTVVFRGTGGTYEAWNDNVTGEYLHATKIQEQAADFINYDCMGFTDLTVTGHSKGGNLAMYTTVVCAASVTACVSFDGQGFSKAFLQENRELIKAAAGKIKSVSAYNDFVNILLHAIAGEQVYAQNPADGIDAHSSYYLLTGNDFDENGNLISTREQGFPAWALGEALRELTDSMDLLPEEGNKAVSDLIAAYVAAAMSEDMGEAYEKGQILEGYRDVGAYLLSLVPGYRMNGTESAMIHTLQKELVTNDLTKAVESFAYAGDKMRAIAGRISAYRDTTDPSERIEYYVNLQLQALLEKLEKRVRFMDTYADTLDRVCHLYVQKEREICDIINL